MSRNSNTNFEQVNIPTELGQLGSNATGSKHVNRNSKQISILGLCLFG